MADITTLKRIDAAGRLYLSKIDLKALEAAPGDLVQVSVKVLKKSGAMG